eukprot:760900-Hanusia_phi.AAC.2
MMLTWVCREWIGMRTKKYKLQLLILVLNCAWQHSLAVAHYTTGTLSMLGYLTMAFGHGRATHFKVTPSSRQDQRLTLHRSCSMPPAMRRVDSFTSLGLLSVSPTSERVSSSEVAGSRSWSAGPSCLLLQIHHVALYDAHLDIPPLSLCQCAGHVRCVSGDMEEEGACGT